MTTAAATAVLLCLAASPRAVAQAHVQEGGDYTVRASTVSAANLPESMREQHGIRTDPNTAVLNVTVQIETMAFCETYPRGSRYARATCMAWKRA